ncbi:rod shape-determining protein MreC [Patescibacteria group bacterium]|nr:rod shape-determining protein MreC [Patescibacteria group bacterium]
MMMNYHSRDNKKRNNNKRVFFIILLLVIIFFYSEVTSVVGGFFRILVSPIWISEKYIDENTINPLGYFASKKNLLVANEMMKDDLETTKALVSDRKILVKENYELKDILGRVDENQDMILTAILSKPNFSLYDSFIVDAGENDGIKKGFRVFAFGNILIGEVDSVNKKTSVVKLYSSFDEQLQVEIGLYNVNAVATGRGGGNFEVRLPRDADIEIGDFVSVAGGSPVVVGFVEEIISTPIDSFKTVLFRSSINLFELKWVQILRQE